MALVRSHGTLYALFLGIVVIATLSTSIFDAKNSGVNKSFRQEMKLMMLIVASPGLRIGRIIRKNFWKKLHPSTSAASSIVIGISLKKPVRMTTLKGINVLVYKMINPGNVSMRLARRIKSYNGLAVTIGGIKDVANKQAKATDSPFDE